jgi:hypothetical protein
MVAMGCSYNGMEMSAVFVFWGTALHNQSNPAQQGRDIPLTLP